MILEYADNSYTILPPTLGINRIRSEANYTPVRAPFSTVQTLSGDGRPKAEPFTISGTAYFADTTAANSWIMEMRSKVFTARRIYVEGWLIELHSADLVLVPNLLPRIVNVTMKVYPANVEPFDWPSGLTLEYRFDEGSGSTLNEYVSGANGTITSPVWSSSGLEMASGRYVTLPSGVTTLLESNNWTQFVAMVGEGTTPASGGVVGSTTTVDLSGEMYRNSTTLKSSLISGTNVNTNLGGDLWNGTPRILHSFRSAGHTRGLDIQPTVDPSYFLIGGSTTTGAAGVRTFGRNSTAYMNGRLMYYVAFNRSLLNDEKLLVYRLIRMKLLERGVSITW